MSKLSELDGKILQEIELKNSKRSLAKKKKEKLKKKKEREEKAEIRRQKRDAVQTKRPEKKEFTQEEKQKVKAMAASGLPFKDIANIMQSSLAILSFHCHLELHEGKSLGLARIFNKAQEVAMQGNVVMLRFLLQSRAGLTETNRVETIDLNADLVQDDANEQKMPLDSVEASKIYQKLMGGD